MTLAFVNNNTITNYPINKLDIRRRFPNTSFPKSFESVDLSSYGVVTVNNTDKPSINTETQKFEEGTPALVDGVWKQVWNVVNLNATELKQITDDKAAVIRSERNQK